MLTYRTKRITKDNHYKWIIQASINDGKQWIIVTNMEGLAPIYNKKPVDVVAALQKRASEEKIGILVASLSSGKMEGSTA